MILDFDKRFESEKGREEKRTHVPLRAAVRPHVIRRLEEQAPDLPFFGNHNMHLFYPHSTCQSKTRIVKDTIAIFSTGTIDMGVNEVHSDGSFTLVILSSRDTIPIAKHSSRTRIDIPIAIITIVRHDEDGFGMNEAQRGRICNEQNAEKEGTADRKRVRV